MLNESEIENLDHNLLFYKKIKGSKGNILFETIQLSNNLLGNNLLLNTFSFTLRINQKEQFPV